GYFDCIILADILEHLREPGLTLKKLKGYLSQDGVIVASIPNVRYFEVLNMLAEGFWTYTEAGILDRTHLRFFTRREIEKMFTEAGLEITGINYNLDPRYKEIPPESTTLSFGRVTINGLKQDELMEFFVFQYILRAKKVPHHNDRGTASDLKDELDRLEEYLRAHPADPDALYRYADVCYRLGRSDRAVESLERLLLFVPDHEGANRLIERIRESTGVS
ncbi:MAG: methyltransferase domain-containing protein, partial [Nitrospirae bacterium]